MKGISLLLTGVTIFTSAFAHSAQETENALAAVNLFSLGFNGFVAKKMPQQLIYEKALSDHSALTLFQNVLGASDATPEAKAYAACGLWEKRAPERIAQKKEDAALRVTLLTGDTLRQEPLERVIENIRLHGCR